MKLLTMMLLAALCASAQTEAKPDQDMSKCPMHAQHQAGASKGHYDDVQKRGQEHQGMGFSQTETTHHFILTSDGGYIQVTANDPKDTESIEQVQRHFNHIADSFAKGDFSIPHFVHDQTPPGVSTMQKLKKQIAYSNEKLENGAKLVISSSSSQAIAAIHDFLRFQISDHQTGDPVSVTAAK
jgi:hypothetical protein